MRHLDLFSGVGGFAYAASKVWPDWRLEAFCEIEPFCQAVLRKNFGEEVLIYDDIRQLTAHAHAIRLQKQGGEQQAVGAGQFFQVDLLTGGFPCQPFSVAGKRKGKEDERYLWGEMFRVIQEFKPRWVLGENVAGIVNLAFDTVLADLESEGYETQPIIIPACAVNAPHRRDRVWFIAHTTSVGHRRWVCSDREQKRVVQSGELQRCSLWRENERCFEQSWLEVAAELCGMDDGFPAGMDGFKLSKAKHREHRIKSLGNAIVPEIARVIFEGMKQTDNMMEALS